MTRKDVMAHLLSAGYKAELPKYAGDTIWHHPHGKCDVQIVYGGKIKIWYKKHPKHLFYYSWSGEFFDR